MNKAKRLVVFVASAFLVTIFAFPVHSAEKAVKIGVINIQKIVALSKVGQAARDEVKVKFEEYQTKLRTEEEALLSLKEDIEKKGSVWSEERRTEKQREFERRVKALEEESKYATNDMKEFEKKKVEPLLKELESIIDGFGKENGYSLIMDSSRGAIYVDESLDISAAVAAELDKRKSQK